MSLYSPLRKLRSEMEPRVFWVDAVCKLIIAMVFLNSTKAHQVSIKRILMNEAGKFS